MSPNTNPSTTIDSPQPRLWFFFDLRTNIILTLAALLAIATWSQKEQIRTHREKMAALQGEMEQREAEVTNHQKLRRAMAKRDEDLTAREAQLVNDQAAFYQKVHGVEFPFNLSRLLLLLDMMKPRHREAVQVLRQIEQLSHGNAIMSSSTPITNDGFYVLIFQALQTENRKPSGSVVALIQNDTLVDLLVRPPTTDAEKWHVVKIRRESNRLESFATFNDSNHTVSYDSYRDADKPFLISYRVTAYGFDRIDD